MKSIKLFAEKNKTGIPFSNRVEHRFFQWRELDFIVK